MIRKSLTFLGLLALLSALAVGAGAQDRSANGWWHNWDKGKSLPWELKNMSPEQRQRLIRHTVFMNQEAPKAYLDAANDVGYTTKAILAGGDLYVANCQKCHGATGLGNGEASGDLVPSPALLAYLMEQPIAVDQYMLWTISEGGAEFGTQMPAFKDILTKQQIWQIVAYLRAGFPEVESASAPLASEAPAASGEGAQTPDTKPQQSKPGD